MNCDNVASTPRSSLEIAIIGGRKSKFLSCSSLHENCIYKKCVKIQKAVMVKLKLSQSTIDWGGGGEGLKTTYT